MSLLSPIPDKKQLRGKKVYFDQCSQSRWSSHSSKSNSQRHWWKLAHIWMGQEADRRLETKMDYKQKVLPQGDPFPLSRHCLPKTHTPPHLPQTAPQLKTKHPIGTYRNYFTSKLDKASTPLTFCWGQVEEGRELRRDNSHSAGHVTHLLLQTPQYPPEQCNNLYG